MLEDAENQELLAAVGGSPGANARGSDACGAKLRSGPSSEARAAAHGEPTWPCVIYQTSQQWQWALEARCATRLLCSSAILVISRSRLIRPLSKEGTATSPSHLPEFLQQLLASDQGTSKGP